MDNMSGFDVVLIIAIILFARLGVRLVTRFIKMKKNDTKDNQKNN
jgi:hypothetical protein